MDAVPVKKKGPTSKPQPLLLEIAWEVCNQVGGIYTVIRSKAPVMVEQAKGNYCMVGPYVNKSIQAELEPLDDLSLEVVLSIAQYLVELVDLFAAPCVLDVDVDAILLVRVNDDLEQIEIHLVVPVIMALPVLLMIEARFVGNNQCAEM